MQICKACGFRNPDTRKRCARCEALLDTTDLPEIGASLSWRERRDAFLAAAHGSLVTLWRRLPLRNWWELPPQRLSYRYPWLAGGLSLLPPCGQIYNRQIKKAVFLGLLHWGGAVVCLFTLRSPLSNWILLSWLFLWISIMANAITTAVRLNCEQWSLRNSLALWFALVFYGGAALTAAQFLLPLLFLVIWLGACGVLTWFKRLRGSRMPSPRVWLITGTVGLVVISGLASLRGSSRVFSFVRVTDDIGSNEIRKGDLLLVFYGAYWARDPARGEIVHFDPPRFTLERTGALSNTLIIVNLKDYVQRVTAMGGETLEIRSGTVLINGKALPPSERSFGWEELPDRQCVVPAGHYFLPVTRVPRDLLAELWLGFLGSATESISPLNGQWVLHGWDEASLVPRREIWGKVLAIVNPPERRRWF